MDFDDCRECGEYKYIERDGLCPSCFEEWVVVFRIPHMACKPDVIEEGLSKRQAESEAEDSPKLIAVPSSRV